MGSKLHLDENSGFSAFFWILRLAIDMEVCEWETIRSPSLVIRK